MSLRCTESHPSAQTPLPKVHRRGRASPAKVLVPADSCVLSRTYLASATAALLLQQRPPERGLHRRFPPKHLPNLPECTTPVRQPPRPATYERVMPVPQGEIRCQYSPTDPRPVSLLPCAPAVPAAHPPAACVPVLPHSKGFPQTLTHCIYRLPTLRLIDSC